MDDFGVLTEQFGLKPQGKSAPMAASRRSTPAQSKTTSSSIPSSSNPNSAYASFLDNQNGFDFLGGGATAPAMNTKVSAFDLDSVFSGSSRAKTASFGDGFDVFGNNSNVGGSGVKVDDFFGSFASAAAAAKKNGVAGNDLLGDLGGVRRKLQSMNVNGSGYRNGNVSTRNGGVSDDLLSGFGVSSYSGSSTQESRTQRSTVSSSQSNFSSPMVDPFLVLEESVSSSTPADSVDYLAGLEQFSKMSNSQGAKQGGSLNSSIKFKAPPKPAQVSNDIDDFEMFASAPVPKTAPRVPPRNEGVGSLASKHGKTSGDDLDFMFGTSFRSSSVPKSRDINLDPIFDAKADNRGGPRPPRTSSGVSGSMKKSSSESGMFDDLFSMDGGSSVVVEFVEVEGESEERRTARLARYQRTKARTLQAVADMNQRDFRTQQEQEERRRIAETMDTKIKSWAAGKEGNMRALLSSLQYVLWPECGWEPVSLTDLITSGSVKKVYRKATLCVHPDKVQQKGASLQQKYTAEKVFDVLKEAWTKFNKEELS